MKDFLKMLLLAYVILYVSIPVSAKGNDTWITEEAQGACVKYGEEYGICPELLMAIIERESSGEQFADWPGDLKGNNDLLCITRPDVIKSIHRQYLDAGADIFATNTFNANAISMEDYGMQEQVRNINLAAGKLAREVADGFMAEHPDRTIFVAGSIGPTNKTASMSPDVSDPAYRAVTYMDLYDAYKEQVDALVDGGVDIVLFETTFDTLNVKAGLEAAETVLKEKGKEVKEKSGEQA